MKNEKKGLLLTALAALFSMAMMTGCEDTGNEAEAPKVTSFEVKKIDDKKVAVKAILSGDNKNIYVTTDSDANGDAGFYHSSDLSKEKFDAVAIVPALGNTAGKANLTGADRIVRIEPAKEGAVVSVMRSAGGNMNGVAYFKGKTPTVAYENDAATERDIAAAVNRDAADRLHGVALQGTANEQLYVFNPRAGTRLAATVAGALGTAGKLDVASARAVSMLTGAVKVATGEKRSFFVNADGVSSVTAANVSGVALEEANLPTVAVANAADASKAGAEFLRVKDAAPVANGAPNAVFLDGNTLYIGFALSAAAAEAPKSGGVAVVEVPAAGGNLTVKAPDTTWGNKAVLGFAHNKSGVYAVTDRGLYKVNAKDAEVKFNEADSYIKSKLADRKDGEHKLFDAEKFPEDKIVGAGFFKGDTLVVFTSNADAPVVVAK